MLLQLTGQLAVIFFSVTSYGLLTASTITMAEQYYYGITFTIYIT